MDAKQDAHSPTSTLVGEGNEAAVHFRACGAESVGDLVDGTCFGFEGAQRKGACHRMPYCGPAPR